MPDNNERPMPNRYRVIIADPPWLFGDKLPGKSRGAAKQYGCLTVPQICRFPLPDLADDALLLLWRVAAMQAEALDVVRMWGFVPKSEIVWEKLTKKGKPWFGMGRFVRASHETCIVATRGRFKVGDRSVRSRFSAPVPVDENGDHIHSAKPAVFHEIAAKLAGGPGVELFARRRTPGWICLGDEIEPQNGDSK
jgi:N6-adenosine-specific RNA methylase IME4